MPIFDFQCECGKVKTATVFKQANGELESVTCECGATMKKQFTLNTPYIKGEGSHHKPVEL